MTLHYDRPATFFEEALVIGNGRIGATIYGGTQQDYMELNDITLWTGEPRLKVFNPEAHTYLASVREALFAEDYKRGEELMVNMQGNRTEQYQPLGKLIIDWGDDEAEVTDYRRWLDISNATAHNSYLRNGRRVETDYFASFPDSVIAVRLRSEDSMHLRLRYQCKLPYSVTTNGNQMTIDGYAAYHSVITRYAVNGQTHFYSPDRGIHFRTLIRVIPRGGSVSDEADGSLVLDGCREALLLIVNATSFNGYDKDPVKEGRPYRELAAAQMQRVEKKAYEKLLRTHVKDFRSLMGRVQLDLGETLPEVAALPTDQQLLRLTLQGEPNPDLEELYFQFGRYLLISSSRTHAVPANLQGLWNRHLLPPWSSNYTVNINLEENYWGAEVTNLSEMHQPLLTFTEALAKKGAETARAYCGVERGWCLNHNSDIWAMTNPVDGSIQYANWPLGGAWVSTHIWEHFLFTQDNAFLAKYYPILRGAAEFCLDWLVEKDGHLLTAPSTSPENTYITDKDYVGAGFYGGAADIAIIRECLANAVEAARVLGKDATLQQRMQQAIDRLMPYRIGKNGNLQEWYHDWRDNEPTHRHQSHLFGLYPGHHITPDKTPDLARAAARTLEIRGMETTGWSAGWRVNLYARLRDRNHAYGMLQKLLRYISPDDYKGTDARRGGGTYPNLLDAHSPFQIDGNFGGSAGIAEMLIQSSPTDIHLLPCLPERWKEGSFKGLCARGGYVIDLEWKDGQVTALCIRARQDGKTTLHFNGQEQTVSLKHGQKKTIRI
ncbi:MAG: glycoside hydrolase family 95 protein [Bacteroidaceae bacterium]|nr:glycoside hydrolase family 95 protein [Bacteroidaceae bacterium]